MKKTWLICIFLALFICVVLVVDSFNPVNEGFDENNSLKPTPKPEINSNKSSMDTASSAKLNATDEMNFKKSSMDTASSAKLNATDGPNVPSSDKATESKYNNTFDVDVQYHDNLDDINAQTDSGVSFGSMNVIGPDGKLITIPTTTTQPGSTYYQPGSYPFGASSYVPSYEDSVFLSKLTKTSTTSPVYNSASELGGFCSQQKSFPYELEQKCNTLDKNTCGSTSCCVLLGGSKCVSGDANGPTMKSNYSDIFVKNKEYYYYQGKCYGNCQD
jgi:hypothetical protein